MRENNIGGIIRYSGEPPIIIVHRCHKQIYEDNQRRIKLMAENRRRILTDYSPNQYRITDEMVEEDYE